MASDVAKRLLVIAFCVGLNLIGAYVTHKIHSLLFLDLIGTALGAMIYGPIHGILVGLLTNGIAELLGREHYFLFGAVQAVCAATWGMLPRLLRGRWLTDFFNDDWDDASGHRKYEYDYPRIMLGLIGVSFVSNTLASLTIACVMRTDPGLLCSVLTKMPVVAGAPLDPDTIVCNLANAIFHGGPGSETPIWQVAFAEALIGWPDHLIALSFAVLLVAHLLPARRHNMTGRIGHEPGPHATVIIIITVAFAVIALLRLVFAQQGSESVIPWLIYAIGILILQVANQLRTRAWDVPQEQYKRINPDLDHAFEDTMRLGVIMSVVVYVLISKWAGDVLGAEGKDPVTGAVGVAFVITFFRYISLIIARASRSLQLPGF